MVAVVKIVAVVVVGVVLVVDFPSVVAGCLVGGVVVRDVGCVGVVVAVMFGVGVGVGAGDVAHVVICCDGGVVDFVAFRIVFDCVVAVGLYGGIVVVAVVGVVVRVVHVVIAVVPCVCVLICIVCLCCFCRRHHCCRRVLVLSWLSQTSL